MSAALDPSDRYVFLDAGGQSDIVTGGAAFWSQPEAQLAQFGNGWLITESLFQSDWTHWEMHPQADEVVYQLEGESEFILEQPGVDTCIRLSGRAMVVVPRGTWHRARVLAPSRMLFVTMGAGTQHRPV